MARHNAGSTASTPNLTEKYRRNGKLQSCEPCRKSKLRCDHVVPACGRCVKRGQVNQCFYHPSPLTQTAPQRRRSQPAASIPTPGTAPSESSAGHTYQSIEADEESPVIPSTYNFNTLREPYPISAHVPSGNNNHVQCQPFHRAASAPPLDCQRASGLRRDTGFEGPTSHLSILSESLGVLEPAPDFEGICSESTIVVSSERVTEGCKVLAFFRSKTLIMQLVGRFDEDFEGGPGSVIEPIMKEWLQQLWIHQGSALASQEPAKIRRLSELIFRNTLTAMEFNGDTTAKEWARLGSGPSLRWEVLGLIALSIGLCMIEMPSEDHFFIDHKVSRACLLGQVKDITEKCLAFCRTCEVLDDMFLWLLTDYSFFIQASKGHRAYATYRAAGETSSAVVAMGLHHGIKANNKVPFFLAEIRKTVLLLAYYSEISLATVLGRPSRLSSRYCIFDLPFDLTLRQIVSTGPELAAALANLDKDGWNQSGLLLTQGRIRALLNISKCREEVLDLALAQYTVQEVTAKAREIQESIDNVIKAFPPCIKNLYGAEPLDITKSSAFKLLSSIPLRIGCQANEILLQRILIRKTGASSEKLIRTARAVFHDVLQITKRHDVAAKYHTSYNMLLSGHGLRVAAIIATELFKQEMLPQYPENPPLPRSQTIQELAVFAAVLGNMDSSAGPHGLCQHGKRVITKILDRILSPPPPAPPARQDGGGKNESAAAYSVVQNSSVEPHVPASSDLMSVSAMDLDSGQPSTSVETPSTGFSLPLPDHGMMNMGIGVEASMVLGQDSDFMSWLDGMNWEMPYNWNM